MLAMVEKGWRESVMLGWKERMSLALSLEIFAKGRILLGPKYCQYMFNDYRTLTVIPDWPAEMRCPKDPVALARSQSYAPPRELLPAMP